MSAERLSIFITGAASGIGYATAKLFVEKGWYVGAFDTNESALKQLEQELGEESCFIHLLDVTDKAAYQKAVELFAKKTNGQLNILFNNAGIAHSGWFEDIPIAASEAIVSVNLLGVINGIYSALPLLKNTKNSLCISTASASATYGAPTIAVYAATKHAVKGLTEALAVEFKRYDIRVSDVLPGFVNTALLSNSINHSPELRGGESIKNNKEASNSALWALSEPKQVAKAVHAAYFRNKLHWYVPGKVVIADMLKGLFPNFVRNLVSKGFYDNL